MLEEDLSKKDICEIRTYDETSTNISQSDFYSFFRKFHFKYLEKYNSLGYIQVTEDTGYMLLRYKTGDYVKKHVDTSSDQHRTLSCSLILNDDYEGGEITFFDGQIKPNLKRGDLLIFPSSFTYPHQVLPVTSGTRYSIITWIR